MKTCRKGSHEYDGDLHSRCPECKKIADRVITARNADRKKQEWLFAKKAPAVIAGLEAENEALRKKVAELEKRQKEKVR